MEGRQPFKYLTVEENLRVGTATRWGKPYKKDLELVYHYFPPLVPRKHALAGYCSGGELQMLVMGRALMAQPRLLLLDEPSLGLAPLLVKEIFEIVKRINEEQRTTLILVESPTSAGNGGFRDFRFSIDKIYQPSRPILCISLNHKCLKL